MQFLPLKSKSIVKTSHFLNIIQSFGTHSNRMDKQFKWKNSELICEYE